MEALGGSGRGPKTQIILTQRAWNEAGRIAQYYPDQNEGESARG